MHWWLIFPLPEISHPIQWLNNKITAPQKYGQYVTLTFMFPLLLPQLIAHIWRWVDPLLWLTLTRMWQRLAHQGQWLGVIHHAANTSAMTDRDDTLQGPWILLLSLSATPELELPGTVLSHLLMAFWLLQNWPALMEQWEDGVFRTSVPVDPQNVLTYVSPQLRP